MPTVFEQGALPLPVTYEDWASWRRDRPGAGELPPLTSTEFCGLCWGRGRILSPAANGEGLVPGPCASCGGAGRVPAP